LFCGQASPRPTGGAPPHPLAGFRGAALQRGRGRKEREVGERKKEGKTKRRWK